MTSLDYMARVPFTLRIDEKERAALEDLSKVEGRPVNQLLNEAIKSYLVRPGHKERSLEANLARLRAYRERDPGFRRAVDAFVKSEAAIHDPLEGEPVEKKSVGSPLKTTLRGRRNPSGPAQTRIRELLGA